MKPLQEKALEGLVDLISGREGPVERQGWDLFHFFKRAGLACPGKDESPDFGWTLDRLREFNRDTAQMEKVLVRLANPIVYHGSLEETFQVISAMNKHLESDGIRVELDEKNKPRVVDRETGLPAGKSFSPLPITSLAPGPADYGAQILPSRLEEVKRCVNSGAFVGAMAILGGLLEEFLVALVRLDPSRWSAHPASPKTDSGDSKPMCEWDLSDLIRVGNALGLVREDKGKFNPLLLNYKTLFQPGIKPGSLGTPDVNSCMTSLDVVGRTLYHVGNLIAEAASGIPRSGGPSPL